MKKRRKIYRREGRCKEEKEDIKKRRKI